jgi:hypothetical protein
MVTPMLFSVLCLATAPGKLAAQDLPHPLLNPTHARLDMAYEAGAKQRRMGDDERVTAEFRKDLGRVRGPKAWKPSQAQFRCSLVDAFLAGYEDGMEKASKGLPRDSDILRDFNGDYGRQVEFVVDVRAYPAFNGLNGDIPRLADIADVEQVTFKLRTQDGRVIQPSAPPTKYPTGIAVVATEASSYDVPVLYFLPHEPEHVAGVTQYEAYEKQYRVWFAIRDDDGRPIATRDHPKITLVMTRPPGDLAATFDLGAMYVQPVP